MSTFCIGICATVIGTVMMFVCGAELIRILTFEMCLELMLIGIGVWLCVIGYDLITT